MLSFDRSLPTATGVAGGGVRIFASVCLCFFRKISRKQMQLGKEMFQDESWKPTYFGVRRSKVKVTSQKNMTCVGLCTLLSAGFF